jgi:HPt (histidine-containing phosphotransfer) domain-containing protein
MTIQEIAPLIDLDLDRSLALFMGKEDMYIKYLKKFPANVEKLLVNLEQAVADNEPQAIEAAAHAIKGVAANLGIQKVVKGGGALMLDIRDNTLDLVAGHYAELVENCQVAIENIEKLD